MRQPTLVVVVAAVALLGITLGTGACGSNTPPVGPGNGADGSTQSEDSGTIIPTDGGDAEGGDGEDGGETADGGEAVEDGGDTDGGEVLPDAGDDDGGTEGPDGGDTADAGDADAGFEGVQCGSAVCASGEVCCGEFVDGGAVLSCAFSCGTDAGVVLECDGPEDCSGGTPVCCGDLTLGPGMPGMCPVQSVSTECTPTCTSNVPLTCNSQGTIQACHARADCTGSGAYTECCTFAYNGQTTSFCSTQAMSMLALGCAP